MTDAEIDALMPGDDLDWAVAEQVLGWRQRMRFVTGELIGFEPPSAEGDHIIAHVPKFSTDIAAAWQIVEHFDNRVSIYGPHAEYAYGEYANHTGWVCEISGQGHYVNARADTAPLAICLAALRACAVST